MASAQDGIGFGASAPLSLNDPARMQRCDSSCQLASLSVSQAGYYKFVLDASEDEKAPVLLISVATDEDLRLINPHEGHELIEKREYQTHIPGVKEVATFSVKQAGADYRSYAQSTTQELRDPGG